MCGLLVGVVNTLVATLRANGTVVLLMGVRTLPDTVAALTAHGISADTPMATIENGYSDAERVTITTLENSGRDCAEVKAPAITVIGEVVYYARDDQQQFVSEVHEKLRAQSTS